MKKASITTSHVIIFVLGILIIGLTVTLAMGRTTPSLETSPDARMSLLAHNIAEYVSFLSGMDSGSILKDLNDTYDIEIKRYSWIRRLFGNVGNYYIRLIYYTDEGKKIEGDKVPIIGDMALGPKGDELLLSDVRILYFSKNPGQPVEISVFSSFAQAGICVPENYRDMITDVVSMSELPALYQTVNPANFVAAIIQHESNFNKDSYRYEPNYDYEMQEKGSLSKYKDDLIMTSANGGITIEEWFNRNPLRAKERESGRDYSKYTAQTRISASYGLMQILYPTAVGLGYKGDPEGLYEPVINIEYGVEYLVDLTKLAKQYVYVDETNLVKIVDGSYNAGPALITKNCAFGGDACTWEFLENRAPDITKIHVPNVASYYDQYNLC